MQIGQIYATLGSRVHAVRTEPVLISIVPKGEVAVPCALFAAILERIQRFGVPPPLLQPV
jgi:hypothetical protein